MKDRYVKNDTNKSQGWIFGLGYDDAILKENRHPTKEDPDKVPLDIPVMACHISGHFSAVTALEAIGRQTVSGCLGEIALLLAFDDTREKFRIMYELFNKNVSVLRMENMRV